MDRALEGRVAQLAPQHVQDPAALRVRVPVEHRGGVAILAGHDRSLVALGLVEVAARHAAAVQVEGVATLGVLEPQRGEVGSEALVEPHVRPLAAGQEVAPPLVRELVGDQRVAIFDGGEVGGIDRAIGERGRRDVLHAAERELLHGRLRVLGPRELDADVARVEVEHRGRTTEHLLGVLGLTARHEVLDRLATPLVRDAIEATDDHAEQVADVVLLLLEAPHARVLAERLRGVGPQLARQRVETGERLALAVGDDTQLARGRDRPARREAIVRVVPGRQPVAGLVHLALRPRLQRLVALGQAAAALADALALRRPPARLVALAQGLGPRLARLGTKEVEADARLRSPLHAQHELLAVLPCFCPAGESHEQLLVVVPERGRLAVDAHRLDPEIDGVQGDLPRLGVEQANAVLDDPGDLAAHEIWHDRNRSVLDIDDRVGGILSGRTGGGESWRRRAAGERIGGRQRVLPGRKDMGWLTRCRGCDDQPEHERRREHETADRHAGAA